MFAAILFPFSPHLIYSHPHAPRLPNRQNIDALMTVNKTISMESTQVLWGHMHLKLALSIAL